MIPLCFNINSWIKMRTMKNQPICLFSIGFSTPPLTRPLVLKGAALVTVHVLCSSWLRVSCVYMALTAVTIFANFYLFCKIWLLSQDWFVFYRRSGVMMTSYNRCYRRPSRTCTKPSPRSNRPADPAPRDPLGLDSYKAKSRPLEPIINDQGWQLCHWEREFLHICSDNLEQFTEMWDQAAWYSDLEVCGIFVVYCKHSCKIFELLFLFF